MNNPANNNGANSTGNLVSGTTKLTTNSPDATNTENNFGSINPNFNFDNINRADYFKKGFQDIIDKTSTQIKEGNVIEERTGEQLLLSDIREIPCLVRPFFQETGLACLAGSSDTGKSTLLRQLVIAIVTNETEFIGFSIHSKHKSAIYVSTEDLEQETAYLLSRQCKRYTAPQLKNLRFIFDTHELLNRLDKSLTDNKADLVVIDCFSDVYGGDLKDTQKIRNFLHSYQELAQKHQCLILFLHHTGKRTENLEPSKNNLLSGQGFEAKMRLVIELRADQMNPNSRHLCIVKGNYLPASSKKESYVLDFDEVDFNFTNTGERTPFEMLAKQFDNDNGKAKYTEAAELKKQGMTHEKIAKALGYGSKGTITKLFNKANEKGWD